MINPIQLLAMAQQSNNPMGLLQQMGGNDPIMQRALQMAQGKTPDQLRVVASNLARQRGMNDVQLAQFLRQFGL